MDLLETFLVAVVAEVVAGLILRIYDQTKK